MNGDSFKNLKLLRKFKILTKTHTQWWLKWQERETLLRNALIWTTHVHTHTRVVSPHGPRVVVIWKKKEKNYGFVMETFPFKLSDFSNDGLFQMLHKRVRKMCIKWILNEYCMTVSGARRSEEYENV